MLVPLSWISDFVKIKLGSRELAWKLTEVGLNTEQIRKVEGEQILDIEVTPNRPDWLSIIGIARELAAIQDEKIKLPEIPDLPAAAAKLPITVKNDFQLCPRYTAVIVAQVLVKPSPEWLQKRLRLVGLRPINNLVDISNYVMFELGIPLHIFDWDLIRSKTLTITQAGGGEEFVSVDGQSFKLPKGAIVIKDAGRVVDLCGIKGGQNTGVSPNTKNILVHVPIYNPALIRRTSKALGLVSEASYIYERGADPGATCETLKRAVSLIRQLSGGKVASPIIDQKVKDFKPLSLSLSHQKLEAVLGTTFAPAAVETLLERLGLKTKRSGTATETVYRVTVPTYRRDLKLEEDLIEEVARLFGYNKFPRTLPAGAPPKEDVAYKKDFVFQLEAKHLLTAFGFSEIKTFSLVSPEELELLGIEVTQVPKVANPVSREYTYLKPTLLLGLLTGLRQNLPNYSTVNLFELERVADETYTLSVISNTLDFAQMKGVLETVTDRFGTELTYERIRGGGVWHPAKTAEVIARQVNKSLGFLGQIHPQVLSNLGIESPAFAFEINFDLLQELAKRQISFAPIGKYPAQIEDLALEFQPRTAVGEVIEVIKNSDKQVTAVSLIDTYQDTRTFRIAYQNPRKTLTDKEVRKIREKILKKVKEKFAISLRMP